MASLAPVIVLAGAWGVDVEQVHARRQCAIRCVRQPDGGILLLVKRRFERHFPFTNQGAAIWRPRRILPLPGRLGQGADGEAVQAEREPVEVDVADDSL